MNPPFHDLDPDDLPPAVGHVPTTGRGALPFAAIHGEPLVVVASWALEDAGVRLLDFTTSWESVQESEEPLVLHDPLCPMTPVVFLREAIDASVTGDEVVVGVRPVTDTVKTIAPGEHEAGDVVVGQTVDREALWTVTSPVVLPARVVAALDDWPDTDDMAVLVTGLRDRFGVRFLQAPAEGARVVDDSTVTLLEALTGERTE